jgi:hypothetical protein
MEDTNDEPTARERDNSSFLKKSNDYQSTAAASKSQRDEILRMPKPNLNDKYGNFEVHMS